MILCDFFLARPLTSEPFHQSELEIGGNVAGRLK